MLPILRHLLRKYDYFIKDHLGNTRMVLTDAQETNQYPAATMEIAASATEELYYSKLTDTRVSLPAGYPADATTNPNDRVARLNGGTAGPKIGPGITLKVMAGDQFSIKASSWYKLNGVNPDPPASPLPDLLTALISGIGWLPGGAHPSIATLQTNSAPLSSNINQFLNDMAPHVAPAKPAAFVNWVLFDNQFNYVAESSGFDQVGADQEFKPHVLLNLPVTKNGYLYIYLSNETPNVDVFFDNLQVSHIRGPLVEEDHYYPFGLTMAGIGDKALKTNYGENKYRFNDKELQNKEFLDGSGLEEYDYGARFQDPQLGSFFTQDRFANMYYQLSPYQYGANNPMMFTDQNGDSLIVGGSASATQTFQQISNTGLGNVATLSATGTGAYSFNTSTVAPIGTDPSIALDAAKSLMTPQQAAFADVLNNAMSATDAQGHAVDTRYTAVDGNDPISHSVFVGDNGVSTLAATPGVHTLDVGDIQAFGSTGALTSQGALAHEIAEGTQIQSKNGGEAATAASPTANRISAAAHFNFAIPAENRVNGSVSGGLNLNNAGILTIPVTVGGVTKTVTIQFTNGNILPGGVQNNTR